MQFKRDVRKKWASMQVGGYKATCLQRPYQFCNMLAESLASSLAAEVRCDYSGSRLLESHLDSLHHYVGRFFEAKVLKHHLAGPDHTDGIGDTFTGDIRC